MTQLKPPKRVCNPFRYLELYELKKLIRNSDKDMPPETKEMIESAIEEKLVKEGCIEDKDLWTV